MSSHPSSSLALSPAQLDRLEDALEELDLEGAFEDLERGSEPDDPVIQRLADYREILQLSREAMPLQEVPAGLLDEVMAQARQAASAAAATGAGSSEKGSLWSRLRSSLWVPTLAFAGSAALLLLVFVPKGADEPAAADSVVARANADADADAKRDEAADARLAVADLDRLEDQAKAESAARGQGLVIGERAPDPAAAAVPEEPEEEELAEPSPEPEPDYAADDELASPAKAKRRKTGSASSSSGSMPKPMPSPKAPMAGSGAGKGGVPGSTADYGGGESKKKDAKKEAGSDPWAEISRADADRRGGNCGLAKMRYDKLRKLDDLKVRARALAGLGLCETIAGNTGTAKKRFEQARASDAGVSGFIDRELASIDGARANADEVEQQPVQSFD